MSMVDYMQAANAEASIAKGRKRLGIRFDPPFEEEGNAFVELAFEHRTRFTRGHHFVLASGAMIREHHSQWLPGEDNTGSWAADHRA